MTTLEAIRIALLSLWANKLRSALTLLGVVIGVAAVIAVVTFVNGINGYVAEKIFNLGADVFIISKVTPVVTNVDQLLEGRRPPGYANQPKSHNAVAAAIAQGRADWGIAIANVAKLYGLAFLPIAPEHFDFLVVDRRRSRPAVQAFLAALAEPTVREEIAALGMKFPERTAP